MPTHTSFKGVEHVSQALLSDQLEANLIGFVQWASLGAGGFFTVRRGDVGFFDSGTASDQSRLRCADDPNYQAGQVWEAYRKDWVWESGVEYHTQPVRVSGVYINGTFRPVESGVVVDYPNGRVILGSPVSPTSTVQCEFSYRLYQVDTADSPQWRTVQQESFRNNDPHFLQTGSGAWDVPPQDRIQLPAVFVEAALDGRRYPGAIGGGDVATQSVVFHVLAEERFHAKWAHDAITSQFQKTINGFDKNRLLDHDAFPLDASGQPRGDALMYPDLVKPTGDGGHFWRKITFAEVRGVPQPRVGGLYYSTVRATVSVDLP